MDTGGKSYSHRKSQAIQYTTKPSCNVYIKDMAIKTGAWNLNFCECVLYLKKRLTNNH